MRLTICSGFKRRGSRKALPLRRPRGYWSERYQPALFPLQVADGRRGRRIWGVPHVLLLRRRRRRGRQQQLLFQFSGQSQNAGRRGGIARQQKQLLSHVPRHSAVRAQRFLFPAERFCAGFQRWKYFCQQGGENGRQWGRFGDRWWRPSRGDGNGQSAHQHE